MCGSGALTGTVITARVRRPTRRDRRQALTASFVVVVGTAARGAAVSRFVATATLPSVSATAVSASSSFLRIRGGVNSQRSMVYGQQSIGLGIIAHGSRLFCLRV